MVCQRCNSTRAEKRTNLRDMVLCDDCAMDAILLLLKIANIGRR